MNEAHKIILLGKSLLAKGEFWTILFITLSLSLIFKDVIFKGNIIFPSNFLATFYSPWATVKYEGFENGVPHKPIGGNDQIRMFYPYRTFINESLAKGEFPLWNPYNFSGSPFIAGFQSAVFYPLNILYAFLPQIQAWSILVVAQPLLGTLFMYLYLHLFVREKLAAFFGAFAAGFSGFIITWSAENAVVGQSALWFGLLLYATEKLVRMPKIKYFLLLVLALSSTILAGHHQIIFSIFIVVFFYGLVRIRQLQSRLVTQARDPETSYIGRASKKIMKEKDSISRWAWNESWEMRVTEPASLFRNIILFFCAFLTSLLLTSIQLLPSIEAFGESTRGISSAETVLQTYLMPLKYSIKLLAPDIFGNPATYNFFGQGFYHENVFYIGSIPLVFAVISLFKNRSDKIVKFFAVASLISFIFAIKSPFSDWFYRLPIPIISTFTPSRTLFITSLSLAILSSFGFSYFARFNDQKVRRIIYITVLSFTAILIAFIAIGFLPEANMSRGNLKISVHNIILPQVMILSLIPLTLLQKRLKFAKIFIVLIMCLGQFYFLNKYSVIGFPQFLYPDHFVFSDIQKNQKLADRFLSFGLPILGDVNLEKKVFSPDGIDPVFPKRYGQLVYAAKNNGKLILDIPRIEVNLSEYAENEDIRTNTRRRRLMSLLGVTRAYNYEKDYKDQKAIDKIFPPEAFTPLWKKDGWQAYQNKNAFPRAYFADNFIIEKEDRLILNRIFDPNVDLRQTAILEEKPDSVKSSKSAARAEILSYGKNQIKIKTDTTENKMLILTDNYYPGWNAFVDHTPAKIYRVDYTFRAIVVPKGLHIVSFIFSPLSFTIGKYISLATGLLLGGLFIYVLAKK